MNAQPTFLTTIGINEADADQIALAIRDLGLGYAPVRDFNQALTIESVVYAMRKSSQSSEDPALAESALACAARVAASNPIMPKIMNDAGISEAVLKLMQRNLSHGPSMEAGCLAVHNIAQGDPAIAENIGLLTGCDVLPRTIRCHIENLHVVYNGCCAIASLATTKDNRSRFSNTGGCDVVIKSAIKSIQAPDVLEKCFLAANRLCCGNQENIGRLGLAGACELAINTLTLHAGHGPLMSQTMELLTFLSVEPSHRVVLGANEAATNAIVSALKAQLNNPTALAFGFSSIASIIMGNAHNRSSFIKVGASLVLKEAIMQYRQDLQLLHLSSKAVFALAAGNADEKQKLHGIQPIYQAVMNARDVPDKVKVDIKEALLKL